MTELKPLDLPAPDADAYLAWISDFSSADMETARAGVAALKENPPATAEETLTAWNDIEVALSNTIARCELFSEVHPDAGVREAAEQASLAARQLSTEFGLDPDLYAVFVGLDHHPLASESTRLLEKILRSFRRSGSRCRLHSATRRWSRYWPRCSRRSMPPGSI